MSNFRNTTITRTCTKTYSDYRDYKNDLKRDFNDRCAYCNISGKYLSTDFEVDHFVPRKEFEDQKYDGRYLSLKTDYANLMYSCKKCNIAKSGQCNCDLDKDKYNNSFFYHPIKDDYNAIFYRNEYGSIKSDDSKGIDIIARLKLYRRIHNLAWVLEQMDELHIEMKSKIENESNPDKKAIYKEFLTLALLEYHDLSQILNLCYKSC